MFDLISTGSTASQRRAAWPLVLSTIAHAAFLFAVVALPLLYITDTLPEVPTMMAFVGAPPPSPPPPPPPRVVAAASPRAVPKSGRFAAPVEAPSRIEPEVGIDPGFEGGVPGGIEGGVPGGLVGGIVGGLPADVPPPPPPVRAVVRIGGQIHAPALVHSVPPRYPELAVRAQIQGTVIIEATVDEEGRVQNARVLRSISLLDEAALDAVRQWRYSPLRLNDQPVRFILTVTVSFTIPRQAVMP